MTPDPFTSVRMGVPPLAVALLVIATAPCGAQAADPSSLLPDAASPAQEQQDGDAGRSLTTLRASIGEVVEVLTRENEWVAGTLLSASDAELTVESRSHFDFGSLATRRGSRQRPVEPWDPQPQAGRCR